MRYFKTVLFATLISSGYCLSASAALPLSSGLYTELNAGAGFNGQNFGSHFDTFSQWFGFSGDLGYKLNMFLALEIGGAHYPDQVNGGQKNTGTAGWDAAGKLIMPFDNGVELFGKVGYTKLYQQISGASNPSDNGHHQGGTLFTGLGISFYGSDHCALTLQGTGTGAVNSIPAQYLATLGITYIF